MPNTRVLGKYVGTDPVTGKEVYVYRCTTSLTGHHLARYLFTDPETGKEVYGYSTTEDVFHLMKYVGHDPVTGKAVFVRGCYSNPPDPPVCDGDPCVCTCDAGSPLVQITIGATVDYFIPCTHSQSWDIGDACALLCADDPACTYTSGLSVQICPHAQDVRITSGVNCNGVPQNHVHAVWRRNGTWNCCDGITLSRAFSDRLGSYPESITLTPWCQDALGNLTVPCQ